MEVALRRRLAGVDQISISQSQQTAVVTFRPGTQVFSAAAFREAVAEADVKVVSLNADVCGVIDRENALRSSQHVEAPLLQLRGGNATVGSTVCVNGRLNEQAQPYELDVMTVRPCS
jgi:hypothetical protein